MSEVDLRVISLGAGVQSSTMYLMACKGVIGPRPDVAIFADTQSEPPWVYEHLAWLMRTGDIPIHVVTAGNLGETVLRPQDGLTRFAAIPVRVQGSNGRDSMLRRQCTREYKIDPIMRKMREMLGLKPKQRAQGRFRVDQWIGISIDEISRVKPSRYEWITTRYPLVFDRPTSRLGCHEWLKAHDYPIPQKSACYFCPFHDDRTWEWMKTERPEVFAQAVQFDRDIRRGKLRGVKDDAFLHRSLQPLDQIEFNKNRDQLDLFANECEGMCGV